MVAHHAQSVGIPPPVALTMMIVGRWTWGRSAYRWTKSAATMALAIRAKSLSASVMRSRRQQPEYAPVKAACSSPVWLNPLLIPTRVKADSFQGFQNGASSESCPSASATAPMHDAQCGLVLAIPDLVIYRHGGALWRPQNAGNRASGVSIRTGAG